jgi:hypothetical protein
MMFMVDCHQKLEPLGWVDLRKAGHDVTRFAYDESGSNDASSQIMKPIWIMIFGREHGTTST